MAIDNFFKALRIVVLAGSLGLVALSAPAVAQSSRPSTSDDREESGGDSSSNDSPPPERRIFSPTAIGEADEGRSSTEDREEQEDEFQERLIDRTRRILEPAEPGEFQVYVEQVIGRELPIFGSDLIMPEDRDFAQPATATIPPDYRLNVGDTVVISLTGSVEGSVQREIDSNGNIFLPSVGNIQVAGVRHGDLRNHLASAIGTQFRNFRAGARVSELRGIRVFVTGFANSPGAFTVGGLSTLANAVFQAGGPSSGGSMRLVRLIRDGQEIGQFDLYDLLRGGSRVNDFVLENEDVILIPPVGRQVAAFGSVNQEAIFELLPGETLADVITLAGGVNSLADPSRLILYRSVTDGTPGPRELLLSEAAVSPAVEGDIVQVLALGSLIQPLARQSVIVRLEGEVVRPGNYFVSPDTPMSEVIDMAGGLTSRAFPYGTQLVRESVRAQQRESFYYAIDQVELTLASAPLTADSSIDQTSQQAQVEAARAVLENLRRAEPDGRLVLEIAPGDTMPPAGLALENNDRIYIPARPSSVGVFGAVYRPASFMIGQEPRRIRDYLDLAGGTLAAADRSDIFVVRANGEVLTRANGALSAAALPGDVVFVPIKANSRDIIARIAQISTVLFQLGIAAATIAAIN